MHVNANITAHFSTLMCATAFAQTEAAESQGLSTAGAAIMIGSIAMVMAFLAFCMYRILRESNPKAHHHTPLEIDTKDKY